MYLSDREVPVDPSYLTIIILYYFFHRLVESFTEGTFRVRIFNYYQFCIFVSNVMILFCHGDKIDIYRLSISVVGDWGWIARAGAEVNCCGDSTTRYYYGQRYSKCVL